MRQTTKENMRDLAQNLGIDSKGKTKGEVMNDLENLAGGSVSQADLDAAVSRFMESQGDAALTEEDFDMIFGD